MAPSAWGRVAVGAASVYNLHDDCSNTAAPCSDAMTEPTSHTETADTAPQGATVGEQLRTRVVREARRETWFVVNEGADDIATIPLDLRSDAALRRVEVNGEVAEFSSDTESVLVRPRMKLRAGAGTIVVLHFR